MPQNKNQSRRLQQLQLQLRKIRKSETPSMQRENKKPLSTAGTAAAAAAAAATAVAAAGSAAAAVAAAAAASAAAKKNKKIGNTQQATPACKGMKVRA